MSSLPENDPVKEKYKAIQMERDKDMSEREISFDSIKEEAEVEAQGNGVAGSLQKLADYIETRRRSLAIVRNGIKWVKEHK